MEKITFNTLYALARKGKLLGTIAAKFDGMTDSIEEVDTPQVVPYTVDMVKAKKMTSNWIRKTEDGKIRLSNCCYRIDFEVLA